MTDEEKRKAARDAGYSDAEIDAYLASKKTAAAPVVAPVETAPAPPKREPTGTERLLNAMTGGQVGLSNASSENRPQQMLEQMAQSAKGMANPGGAMLLNAMAHPANTAAAIPRYGAPFLAAEGGVPGAVINAGGEALAQKIEGSNDPRRVAMSGAMGAVPFAPATKVLGAPNLLNAMKASGVNYSVNKIADLLGIPGDTPNATKEAAIVAAATALSPVIGKALGSITGHVSPQDAAKALPTVDDNATKMAREQLGAAREYQLPTPTGETRRLKVDPTVPAVRNEGDLLLKSMAGKAAIAQTVAKDNVPVFQGMGQQDLGLKQTGGGITAAQIKDAREKFYEPYAKIKQVASQARDQLKKLEDEVLGSSNGLSGPEAARRAELEADPQFQRMAQPLRTQAAADVDGLRAARGKAASAMKQYIDSSGKNVEALAEYKAQKELSDELEEKINDAARLSDDETLVERLTNARAQIARSHNYEDAIGPDGIINPQALRMMDRAGVPLGGNAKKIADFAHSARGDAVELSRIGDPNANAAGGIIGMAGAVTSPKTGFMAAGIPFVRNWARKKLLDESRQAALINPPPRTPSTSADPAIAEMLARLAANAASKGNVYDRVNNDPNDVAGQVTRFRIRQALGN